MTCDCYTTNPIEPYYRDGNYYCATCKLGQGNAYFAARKELDAERARSAALQEEANTAHARNAALTDEGEEMDARWHAEVAALQAELESWRRAHEQSPAEGEV